MSDAWYRTEAWSEEDREEFERRLKRARPHNRPQYLRVKALSLQDHGGRAERLGARELFERVLRDYPASAFDVAVAREGLAQLAERDGWMDEAINHWRVAIYLIDEGMPRGDACLRLPELLIASDEPERWDEAASVLARVDPQRDFAFSDQRFRYAVLRARLADRNGDPEAAARFADAALIETERTKPDFARHPDLGWANGDAATLSEMRRLAGRD
jgi:hypothetical protein